MFLSRSVCVSASASVCLSLSVCFSTFIFVCLSVSVCVSAFVSVRLCLSLFICGSVCVSASVSVSGPSLKYVTLFFANFDPPPLSHCVTHPVTPESTSHISDPPPFLVGLVQKSRTKVPCTNSISIVRGGF